MADKDLNRGDVVWAKLYYDKTESIDMSGNHVVSVRSAHPDAIPRVLGCLHVRLSNVMPDHPALPKLAALLADPAFAVSVESAVAHYQTHGLILDEDMVALVTLAAALTEGTGDGDETQ